MTHDQNTPSSTDASTIEPGGKVHNSPNRVLILLSALIPVLVGVVRCNSAQKEHEQQSLPSIVQRANLSSKFENRLRDLQDFATQIELAAQQAEGGHLRTAVCDPDHRKYAQIMSERDAVATELDQTAASLGQDRYISLNMTLIQIVQSAAESSERLGTACAAPKAPR